MHWTILLSLTLLLPGLAGCLSGDADTPGSDDVMTDRPPATVARVGGSNESATAVPDGEYNFTGPYSRLVESGDLAIQGPQRITIPSDQDGSDIEMAIWLPDTDEPVPVLMFSSPYFVAEQSLGGGSRTVDAPGGSVQVIIDEFVPHGYAFATHAVRGTAGSDGCNDLMGPAEVADIDQAVTWLGTQDWSNGNVGMTGVSYDGSTPWSAATTGNPHLATIIPISGVPDIYGLMYRNGSSETRGPVLLNALYYEGGIASGPDDPQEALVRALCPEAWEGLALSAVAGVTGFDPTGYWQERDRKPGVAANYNGSVFSVQGLQDWNVDPSQVIPWVDELDRQGIKTKQLLGQWGHAWPDSIGEDGERIPMFRADYKEILLDWLDSELKGLDVDTGAPVQVMDDRGRWRNEATFPPRDADWTPLYLGADGQLVTDPGTPGQVTLLPNANPGAQGMLGTPDAAGTPEFHVDYELGVPDDGLLVSGLPKVHVTVVPHGPGGYMAAYLYARNADGEDRRVGWTTMNLAFADGTHERKEVVPGMPLEVKMEVQPLDAALRDGERLVLRLWVFTDGDRLPTLPPNGVDLLIGDDRSVLRLPTVERDESVYFDPPAPPEEDEETADGTDGQAAAAS